MTSPFQSSFINPNTGCPAGYTRAPRSTESFSEETENEHLRHQEGVNLMVEQKGLSYGEYLNLDKILDAQEMQSCKHG
ncbi:tryptophan 2,3-dioxygenase [Eurytemora carolleeae]|uniref:tryptophan 2,3-dioxygenase n=1 Tax=Eurytemora carolleeae TaxID=1294199 RepID=UPI000C767783|nr:tryptophan 2,3-dioxygenase [Eurytemora carolleeae]|eukprot:XP_023335134.1 tryptophan 2,3-dioxygenase-like [Eurytemora affinis]